MIKILNMYMFNLNNYMNLYNTLYKYPNLGYNFF